MRTWELPVAIDTDSPVPVFLQIARAVADDVRRGRLRPGDPLPGSRPLADSLAVHRNTVLAAYRELTAEGWITTSRARGTFVSDSLPDAPPRRFSAHTAPREIAPGRTAFPLRDSPASAAPVTYPRGVLALTSGVPDVRLVPTAALARAYRRALAVPLRSVLAYADPRGQPRLREALARMLAARRGLAITADEVLVTRGSQMALDLVSRGLLRPGDTVAVEALGYRPAWESFRLAGARVVPLALDRSGLDIDALTALAARERVRAVYLTPHHQYPTTVVLAASRRLALLDFARRHGCALLEDDYDHEFHYDGRPVLPLASADRHGTVVYIGTLSKLLAPGLRVGFVAGPKPLIEHLAAHRSLVDRQGDHAVECALAELIEEGEMQRHAGRARRAYDARRHALSDALQSQIGSALRFDVPRGGMAFWAEVAPDIDVDAWAARGLEHGVAFHPGRHYAFDGRTRPHARLAFAALTETELRDAVRRMKRALPRRR